MDKKKSNSKAASQNEGKGKTMKAHETKKLTKVEPSTSSQSAAKGKKMKVDESKPPSKVEPSTSSQSAGKGKNMKLDECKPPSKVEPITSSQSAGKGKKMKLDESKPTSKVEPSTSSQCAGKGKKMKLDENKPLSKVEPSTSSQSAEKGKKMKVDESKPPSKVEPITSSQIAGKGKKIKLDESKPPSKVEPNTSSQSAGKGKKIMLNESKPLSKVEPSTSSQSAGKGKKIRVDESKPPSKVEPSASSQSAGKSKKMKVDESKPPSKVEPSTSSQSAGKSKKMKVDKSKPPSKVEPSISSQSAGKSKKMKVDESKPPSKVKSNTSSQSAGKGKKMKVGESKPPSKVEPCTSSQSAGKGKKMKVDTSKPQKKIEPPIKTSNQNKGKGKKGQKVKMSEAITPSTSSMMDVDDFPEEESSRNVAYIFDPNTLDDRTIGAFLSQPTPILLKILSHLSHGDLQNCARVCRTWTSFVKTILQKRFSYEWFYAGKSLNDLKCLPERFAKFSKEIKIAPQLILGFEPTEAKFPDCDTCQICKGPKEKKKEKCRSIKNNFEKVYQSAFPKAPAGSCRITSYGVISSYLGEFHTLYTNEDNDFNQSTLLFPTCDGLEISTHLFRQIEIQRLTKFALTRILTGHDLSVKAVLIYLTDASLQGYSLVNNGYSLAKHTASILRKKQKTPAVSIGGGVVKKIRDTLKPNVSYHAAMFIFRGAKVSAYSTVMKETEPSNICSAIKNMSKKINEMPGRKLCFMTECIERQSLYITENLTFCCNLESRCLNRFLPGVPVFGFWSHGEIGFTTPDDNEKDEENIDVAYTQATSYLFLILED